MRIFNSRDKEFRCPTGAVKSETNVHFKIVLPRHLRCSGAVLMLKDDRYGDTKVYSMFWCGMVGDDHEQWECDVEKTEVGLYWYYFGIDTCQGKKYITKGNYSEGILTQYPTQYSWQLLCYDKDFKTPSWLRGGIMYQIFPDRFYNSGKPKKGVYPNKKIQTDWNIIPDWQTNEHGEITNSDFFGGDLKGITLKLPYLKSLGVTCIYLNPIFEAYSNHRYDTGNYEKIDPILGDEEDFKELCEEAGKLDIHIINDGVFSHTGSDSVYFNREGHYDNLGAYNSKESPYHSWYKFHEWPNIYDSWWGFYTLPEVNEMSISFNEYINGENGIVRKWIKNGNSGWRLDVADELPDEFIVNVREAVKAENPDAMIIGEVWEDASNKISYGSRRKYLWGKELDSVMNYVFRNAILGFLDCGDGRDMIEMVLNVLENYPEPVIHSLMNFLGTHDTERAITLLAGEKSNGRGREWQANTHLTPIQRDYGIRRMKLASGILYTLPGVPCIYYGDEAGVEGYKDPFNRSTYPWGNEEKELLEWYKGLGEMRHKCSCLTDGTLNEFGSTGRTMGYIRENEEEMLICVFNAADYTINFRVPDDFIGGETFMNTNLSGNELTISRDSCAFVRVKKKKTLSFNEIEEELANALNEKQLEESKPKNANDIPDIDEIIKNTEGTGYDFPDDDEKLEDEYSEEEINAVSAMLEDDD